jgi:hypothetical protein
MHRLWPFSLSRSFSIRSNSCVGSPASEAVLRAFRRRTSRRNSKHSLGTQSPRSRVACSARRTSSTRLGSSSRSMSSCLTSPPNPPAPHWRTAAYPRPLGVFRIDRLRTGRRPTASICWPVHRCPSGHRWVLSRCSNLYAMCIAFKIPYTLPFPR